MCRTVAGTQGDYERREGTRRLSCKILVVEDKPDTLKALTLDLRAHGYSVVTANGGVEAVTVALRERPDAILLDIAMPDGDGHTVARMLNTVIQTCGIPIIVLTGNTREKDCTEAHKVGAVKCITKPYHPDEILNALDDVLTVPGTGGQRDLSG